MFLVVYAKYLLKVNSQERYFFFQKWQNYEFKAKKLDKRLQNKDNFQDLFKIDRVIL